MIHRLLLHRYVSSKSLSPFYKRDRLRYREKFSNIYSALPTGSWKTTILYFLLHHAREMINRNIITLEDPIENVSEKVLQVQINEKAGITYSVGLKAVLRHDLDVIIVGEVRDAEIAKIAVPLVVDTINLHFHSDLGEDLRNKAI